MKHLLLLFAIAACSIQLNAQKWGNPTAIWRFSYQWGWQPGSTYQLQVEGDTLIDGKQCIKIGKYVPQITYLSGDTVYFYMNGAFRPTYYFAANVGDTISFYDEYGCDSSSNSLYATIDSVDSINVGSRYLKYFSVSVLWKDTSPQFLPKKFKYYEGAGSDAFFRPQFSCFIDPEYNRLCNYGDSSIQDFWLFPNRNCDTVTAIAETKNLQVQHHWQSENLLSISPDEACNLALFNIAGQQLMQQSLRPGENLVSIPQPQGFYIALLQAKESYKTIKLYKQPTH
jgi:hypothetical protein